MVATSAKRGRGRPSAGAAKVKSPPKKATGVKAAAKRSRPVRTPAAKTLPAKRKRVKKVIIDSDDGEADSPPRKGSSKVTDRKLVNNVVHYKLAGDKKNGGGWKAVFDFIDLTGIKTWELKNKSSKKTEQKALDEDDQEFVVDKIVAERIRYNKIQYKVRWQGFPAGADSWEKADKMVAETTKEWEGVKQKRLEKKIERSQKTEARRQEKKKAKAATGGTDEKGEKIVTGKRGRPKFAAKSDETAPAEE